MGPHSRVGTIRYARSYAATPWLEPGASDECVTSVPTVLVVGDCDAVLQGGAGLLQQYGYDVLMASSGREGVALTRAGVGDAVVTSLQCADISADSLLQQLHGATADRLPVVVTLPAPDCPTGTLLPRTIHYVHPAAIEHELVAVVEQALGRRRGEAGASDAGSKPGLAASRVMLATESQELYDALEAALTSTPGLHVVTPEAGERLSPAVVRSCAVDLVLIGALAHQAIVGTVRELAAARPQLRIVLFGLMQTGTALIDLLDAGASGLLPHGATVDEIVRSVRIVASGATVIPQSLTRSLLAMAADRCPTCAEWRGAERVSKREHEIIALIAEGLSNKEIATRLNIATFTVKSHVHNILQKLGLETRAQVAREFLLRSDLRFVHSTRRELP